MAEFTVHDEETAPEQARPMLAGAQRRLGFVSTLAGVMAESPELLGTVAGVPILRVVAAHSTMALRAGLDQETVAKLRDGKPLDDPALEAVRAFTKAVVDGRGWVDDAAVDAFLAAGFGRRQLLDVVLGVGVKTLSNYTNHIASTPLDPAWAAQEWTPREGHR